MEENREEELNKKLFALLGEAIAVQKNLSIVKAAQARDEAKATVKKIKENVNSYIETASNGYIDRKGKTDSIKKEYAEVAQDLAETYKQNMDMYNVQRQEKELKLNGDRCSLAQANKEKLDIESKEVYKKFQKLVESSKLQIILATKEGNLEEVKAKTEELELYQKDFAKSSLGKQYYENKDKITQLKQSIKESREHIKVIKTAEKETRESFKINQKKIISEKNTQLAKIERQSKLKSLIGKIVTMFSGEKGFYKRAIEPTKEKLELAKEALPKIKEDIHNRQIATIEKVTDIKSKGKEMIIDKYENIKGKVSNGINAIITKINDEKNNAITSVKNKLIDSKERAQNKIQQIETERAK